MNAQYSGIYTPEASWRFAKLDELSVGFRTLRLSAPQKMPQKGPAPNAATLRDCNSTQPISKIPIELLCEIFTKFVNDPTISRVKNATGPLVSRHSNVDPTILGQVCSHWRNVALNLPDLWSTIFIRNPAKSQLYRTYLWLERSADQPLNLTLEDGIDNRDLNATWNILRAFYSHAAKWRRIDLSVPPDLFASIGRLGQDAPPCKQLEIVKFRTSHPFSSDFRQHEVRHPMWQVPYHDEIWSFFNSSPKLRDVSYFADRPDIMPRNTPYGQLTSIDILFYLSPEDLLGLISLLPNLGYLRANVTPSHPIIVHSTMPATSFPVTLKDLHTLRLSAGISLTKFFSQLILPSLEQLFLSLRFSDGQTVHHHSAIQYLLHRSNCRLRKLEFVDRNMNEAEANAYFKTEELQDLSFLEFRAELSAKSMALLSEKMPGRQHTFLPMLQEMHLSRISDTPDGMLSRMISSRQPLLREFTILTADGGYGPLDEAFFVKYLDKSLQ